MVDDDGVVDICSRTRPITLGSPALIRPAVLASLDDISWSIRLRRHPPRQVGRCRIFDRLLCRLAAVLLSALLGRLSCFLRLSPRLQRLLNPVALTEVSFLGLVVALADRGVVQR